MPEEKKKKSSAQEFIELVASLGTAVLIALLLKRWLIEVFVIPSGSMEPTLHGRTDGGDRVLCTKFSYRFFGQERRMPTRWEIFVFEYPSAQAVQVNPQNAALHRGYAGQNFIKRCLGLPGETIRFARGDVWARAKEGGGFIRQAKPDAVQRSLWIPVYEEDFADLGPEELAEFWTAPRQGGWAVAGGALRLDAGASIRYRSRCRGASGMRELTGIPDRYVLRQPVTFRCPRCGASTRVTVRSQKVAVRCGVPACRAYLVEDSAFYYGRRSDLLEPQSERTFTQGEDKPRGYPYHIVPDLRVHGRARVAAGGKLGITLLADGKAVRFAFGDGKAGVRRDGEPAWREAAADLPAGAWREIEAYVADGVARAFVDGTPVWPDGIAVPLEDPNRPTEAESSGIELSAEGGAGEWETLAIDRDIHWFHDSPRDLEAEDGFLALGDNAPSSNDSRTWGPVPRANVRGPAILVWWPPHRVHTIPQP